MTLPESKDISNDFKEVIVADHFGKVIFPSYLKSRTIKMVEKKTK